MSAMIEFKSGDILKDDAEALAGWGQCLRETGRLTGARRVFARLLEGSPDHVDGRLAMGEMSPDDHRRQRAPRFERLREISR